MKTIKLELEGVMMNVVSDYALHGACAMKERKKIWSELNETIESISGEENVVMGVHIISHVGED